MPTSQNVRMQIGDCLTTVRSRIQDDTYTGFCNAQSSRYLRRRHQNRSRHLPVCIGQSKRILDRLFWDHKDMYGRLRRHIAKGDDEIIFIDRINRNLFSGDFTEDTVSYRITRTVFDIAHSSFVAP